MKKATLAVLLSLLLTFIIIFVWNIGVMSIIPSFGFMDFRLNIASVFVVFFALYRRGPITPLIVLYVEFVQSMFSVTGWGHHVLAGILVLLLARLLKSFINTSHVLAAFLFIWGLIILKYMFSSFFWVLKIEALSSWPEMVVDYLPQSILLAFLSFPLFKVLDKVWKNRGSDNDTEFGF